MTASPNIQAGTTRLPLSIRITDDGQTYPLLPAVQLQAAVP